MIKVRKVMKAASLMEAGDEHTDEAILAAMKKLTMPVACTLKKDGIRALRLNASLLSLTLKQIPNKSIRQRSLRMAGGMDMELWNPDLTYDQIESIVMSREHVDSDKIGFHILDHIGQAGYLARIAPVYEYYKFGEGAVHADVNVELPVICKDANELMEQFIRAESLMGEGICFRTLMSPYKQGRSTLKEQYLVKLCRFTREEVVIDSISQMIDERENLKPTMGALQCVRANGDITAVGTGYNQALRKQIWDNKEQYIGKTITIKYKGHGMKDRLRAPVFVGFRKDGQ